MRPSDYLWENVATPREVVALKTFISNALALLILIVGFTCIIAAKGAETSTLLRLGQTDCTLYEFVYSGAHRSQIMIAMLFNTFEFI